MKRIFRTQFDFISVLKISATLGFGSGIFLSVLTVLPFIHSGEWFRGVLMLFLTPAASAFGAVITGVLGFPFYYWYSNKIRGQLVAGKYSEVPEKSEI